MKVRMTTTPTSVFACVYPYTIDTGVEIVSVYLLSGLTTTFLKIAELAPHFLFILTHRSGA